MTKRNLTTLVPVALFIAALFFSDNNNQRIELLAIWGVLFLLFTLLEKATRPAELSLETLWVTGQFMDGDWELCGIFDSEAKAVAACLTCSYFVAPFQLNDAIHESTEWSGIYIPVDCTCCEPEQDSQKQEPAA